MTTPLDLGDDAATPGWLRAWNRFWFAPVDPTGLGFMRVCCGLVVFGIYLAYSYDLFSYVGPNAWLDTTAQNYIRKDYPIVVPPDNWTDPVHADENVRGSCYWSIYYHISDPFWVVVIHVSILVVMLLFTVGLWTRVTSVLAWFGAMQYVERLSTHMYGQDAMLVILMLYLMIGDSGAALSVDRWLALRWERQEWGRRADTALKPSWSANFALRLVQIHVCIIYMVAGMSKLLGPAWWNGTALWLCLANYNFAPMRVGLYDRALTFLCNHRWLWEISLSAGTLFTLFTELSFSYLVWWRRWRPFMVSCSTLMHLGIGLIMGLTAFSLLMLVMVMAFVPPEVTRAFVDDLLAKVRGRPQARPAAPAAYGVKEPAVVGQM